MALLFPARAGAASITLAWDANTEPDIAGYIVQWGTAAGRHDTSVDVGNVTTWTFASATSGQTYYFVVRAYNRSSLQSDPSLEVSGMASDSGGGPPVPTPDTRLSVNRSALYFGASANGAIRTGTQTVRVGFTNGAASWSVTSSAPWAMVSPASGAGAGMVNVTVNAGAQPAGTTLRATLTVTAPGVANSPLTVPVQFSSYGATGAPFGYLEALGTTQGITGALAVTGWALDDIGVTQIALWRDPVAGEAGAAPDGKVFIGRAVQVEGARPDVDAGYSLPYDYSAGWGYLLLTNMLPARGNGTFVLHAYADDAEGHHVLLGSTTIACDNAHATRPFGSIDTPDQGGTASGTTYTNFGWALAPLPNSIPINGSTITVYIDGVPVGHPVYNQNRSDIATLFPGLANSNGAIGYFQFDTTTLANGVHTIAWGVTDNAGNSAGIGSRYFTVFNGGTSSLFSAATAAGQTASRTMATEPDHRAAAQAGSGVGQSAAVLETAPVAQEPSYVRRGFDGNASLDLIDPDYDGVPTVSTPPLSLVRVVVGPSVSGPLDEYEGYLLKNGELAALPAGSMLDRQSGEFNWQPGVGFSGTYDFVFVRTADGFRQRVLLRVRIE